MAGWLLFYTWKIEFLYFPNFLEEIIISVITYVCIHIYAYAYMCVYVYQEKIYASDISLINVYVLYTSVKDETLKNTKA